MINDLPSVVIQITADQILNSSLCCSYKKKRKLGSWPVFTKLFRFRIKIKLKFPNE